MRETAGRRPLHPALRLIPQHFFLLAIAPPGDVAIARYARPCKAHIPQETWPTIAERAAHESLRDLAAEYGVCHETIRKIVRSVTAAEIANHQGPRSGDVQSSLSHQPASAADPSSTPHLRTQA